MVQKLSLKLWKHDEHFHLEVWAFLQSSETVPGLSSRTVMTARLPVRRNAPPRPGHPSDWSLWRIHEMILSSMLVHSMVFLWFCGLVIGFKEGLNRSLILKRILDHGTISENKRFELLSMCLSQLQLSHQMTGWCTVFDSYDVSVWKDGWSERTEYVWRAVFKLTANCKFLWA